MRTFKIVIAFCLIYFGAIYNSFSQSSNEDFEKQKDSTIQELSSSESELNEMLNSLDSNQWNFKPSEESWSVSEVCQHLLLIEAQYFDKIKNEILKNDVKDQKSVLTDNELYGMVRNRENKVSTIPEFEPKDKISKKEFIRKFSVERKKTIALLKQSGKELRNHFGAFSPRVGEIDGFQWFIFIAGHNDRHNAQILEITENSSFPK